MSKTLNLRNIFRFSLIIVALLAAMPVYSQVLSGVTYHGRILRANGTAVDGQDVGFRIRVMDGYSGSCQMYEEVRTLDMRNRNGVFSIPVGNGAVSGTYGASGITFFDELFLNGRTFNFTAGHPCVSTPYVAGSRDPRMLSVAFRESPTDPWESLPVMTVTYVPFAYNALVANSVGSHTQASLLRVENAGVPQSIAALTPANYTTLMTILGGSFITSVNGTAGQITANTSSGTATIGLADVSGVTPATYGSSTLVPVITVDQKGRITAVTTAAMTGGGGSSGISALTGEVTASGSGSVAATITAGAVTATKLATDSVSTVKIIDGNVTLAKLASDSVNSAKIVDGSILGADIASTAALSIASIAATGNVGADTMSTNGIALYELPANGTNYVMLKAADNVATNLTFKWPATDGGSGQVLSTDGSGNLGWVAAGSANAYVNGGNAFTANASIGLTDAYRLDVKTNNLARITVQSSGEVGIGTTNPAYPLTIGDGIANDGFLMAKGYGTAGIDGTTLSESGSGTRMFWYPKKAAFRAGGVTGTQWDNANIGDYSFAAGYNARAAGAGAFAGGGATVNGNWSTGLGWNVIVSSDYSAAIGADNFVSGVKSYAYGTGLGVSGFGASAFGWDANVSGNYSMSFNTTQTTTSGPTVSGTSSIGMFLGDVGPINLSANNTMAIYGGNVGIGTTTALTRLNVAGSLTVGDGGETCASGNFIGAIRYNGGNLQFCNGTAWNSLGVSGAGLTALTGDVLATGSGSVVATIASDAVSFAKMQDISTNKILGRSTASSGDIEELSIGTGLNLASGVLSYSGSDTFAGLPCGNGFVPYKSAGTWGCREVASINTVDSIITRDVSGNFVAGTGTFNTSVKITDGAAGGQVTLSAPAAFTSYSLKLPTADGSANQVLKTDGSGNLGWAAAGSANAYVNGGNAFAANATIGLTDAYRLDFKTNNTAQMTISASGNVGIGTTSPTAMLTIVRPDNTTAVTSEVYANNLTAGVGISYAGISAIGSNANVDIGVTAKGTGNVGLSGNAISMNSAAYFAGTSLNGEYSTNANGALQINYYGYQRGITQFRDLNVMNGKSSSVAFFQGSTGYVGIGTTAPTEQLTVVGNVLATAYLYSSDERLKKDIQIIPESLQKILSLKGVTYHWRSPASDEDRQLQMGVIAQDVEKVFPEAVRNSSDGIKRVNYPALVAPLIQAVKELYSEIEGLKAENKKLAQENERQSQQLNEVMKRLDRLENKPGTQ